MLKKNKKTTKYNNNNESDSDTNSDNLSEELKKIIAIPIKSIIQSNNILNNNLLGQENIFDISKIYADIYGCFQKYKLVTIQGEITAFKITDDNAWITIKSIDYQISGIFWKICKDSKYIYYKTFKIGDKLTFQGNFGIMKKNLNIYFNIKSMEKTGKGDYMDIYEQYRIKIKEQRLGLPKKTINSFPYNIGIITAIEGAAIQDILQTLRLDNFIGNIIIKNSIVQGINCSKSIINSIEWFEQNYFNIFDSNKIDLLMVTRGGGSYEDLVGFSDWDLLVKIANTPFITFSAVGHQIDNQLSDEVADYKFATPSIGAKYIVEVQNKYKTRLSEISQSVEKIKLNYNRGKDRFELITRNYDSIIKSYDIKNIITQTTKYSSIIRNITNKYNQSKINFLKNLSNIKPSIYRNGELVSINDFINFDKNKPINPKKIEIKLIDGKINITYKIIDYEQYN